MKLDVWRFALAGGLYGGVMGALVTIASLLRIPGYPPFTKILTDLYGSYGYSVTRWGVVVGAW